MRISSELSPILAVTIADLHIAVLLHSWWLLQLVTTLVVNDSATAEDALNITVNSNLPSRAHRSSARTDVFNTSAKERIASSY